MSEPTKTDKPEPTPFQRFDAVMRKVVSTPKAEVDRRMEEAKNQRRKRATQR